MTTPNWSVLTARQTLKAPTDKLWVKVFDYVRGPRALRVEATGSWSSRAGSACGPDGDPAIGFENGNLHTTALRGCLLAKIGGSGGDTPGEGKIQAVGSEGTFDIPEGASGALFLTMNDDPKQFSFHEGTLKVTIWEAPCY